MHLSNLIKDFMTIILFSFHFYEMIFSNSMANAGDGIEEPIEKQMRISELFHVCFSSSSFFSTKSAESNCRQLSHPFS